VSRIFRGGDAEVDQLRKSSHSLRQPLTASSASQLAGVYRVLFEEPFHEAQRRDQERRTNHAGL